MNKTAKFWNKVANKYTKQPVPDQAVYDKKLQLTQAKMNPDMHVMEFGCGTGTTALIHAPYVKHLWATDVSDEMIRIAQENADSQNIKNINFECIGIDDMNLPSNGYDMVMGHSILHLLKNKDQVIKDVYTTIKPGGWFISSTTCMGDKLSFFKWLAPIGKFFGIIPTLNVFTRNNLIESISNAGFIIEHKWQPNEGHNLFIIAQKPLDN